MALLSIGLAACIWAGVGYVALSPVLPDSPLSYGTQPGTEVHAVLPQGWKFYTRDPREANNYVYQLVEGTWQNASIGPNARPAFLFGINRRGRAQGLEYGLLVTDVDPMAWEECEEHPFACLARLPAADTLANASPDPTLCGTIALVRQPLVPWAWRTSADALDMPSLLIRLEVTC